jgi:hypothetical protein
MGKLTDFERYLSANSDPVPREQDKSPNFENSACTI